jgi:hypothetical protein
MLRKYLYGNVASIEPRITKDHQRQSISFLLACLCVSLSGILDVQETSRVQSCVVVKHSSNVVHEIWMCTCCMNKLRFLCPMSSPKQSAEPVATVVLDNVFWSSNYSHNARDHALRVSHEDNFEIWDLWIVNLLITILHKSDPAKLMYQQ